MTVRLALLVLLLITQPLQAQDPPNPAPESEAVQITERPPVNNTDTRVISPPHPAKQTLPDLIRGLSDNDAGVRRNSVVALRGIGLQEKTQFPRCLAPCVTPTLSLDGTQPRP